MERGRRAFPFGAFFQAQGRTVSFAYCFSMFGGGFDFKTLGNKAGKTWFCLSRNLLSTTSIKPFWGCHICQPPFHWDVPGCCAIQVSKHLVSPQIASNQENPPCGNGGAHGEPNFDITFQATTRIKPWKQTALTRLPSMAPGSRPDFVHHL